MIGSPDTHHRAEGGRRWPQPSVPARPLFPCAGGRNPGPGRSWARSARSLRPRSRSCAPTSTRPSRRSRSGWATRSGARATTRRTRARRRSSANTTFPLPRMPGSCLTSAGMRWPGWTTAVTGSVPHAGSRSGRRACRRFPGPPCVSAASSARSGADRATGGQRPSRPGRAAPARPSPRRRGRSLCRGCHLQDRDRGRPAAAGQGPAAGWPADPAGAAQQRGRVQHRDLDDDRVHPHRGGGDLFHPAHVAPAAQPAVGGHPGPAAGRGHGQSDRPAAALTGAVPRRRRGLDPAAPLAGLQRGRLGDRLRRGARRAARGAWHPPGRDPRRERYERRAWRPTGQAGGRAPGPGAGGRAGGAGPRAGQRGRGQPGVTAGDQRRVAVPEGLDGERLDAALARMFGLSRTAAADLISGGQVLVAGRAVVYEDADIVVVDKPAGVAAHPTPGWSGPTVLDGLLATGHSIATSGAAERQGIVHRLDANTTGLMVLAKSERAYSALKRAFRERTVDKGYRALVQGHPDPLRGTVDAPIARHPSGDGRFAVITGGRPSVTHYDTIEAFRGASLLAITLESGRTQQIRVQMAALRHPCVGYRLYGADPVLADRLGLTRQWLHAVRLGFAHPADGHWAEFTSAHPADLAHALEVLRSDS